jgi:hypothetical protein
MLDTIMETSVGKLIKSSRLGVSVLGMLIVGGVICAPPALPFAGIIGGIIAVYVGSETFLKAKGANGDKELADGDDK